MKRDINENKKDRVFLKSIICMEEITTELKGSII